jgi:hypothetical protein
MANRRITDLQEIAGIDVAEADLFTLVHVDEPDPALKNKKITLSGTKQYLNIYYLPRTGGTISGSLTVQNNVTTLGLTTTSGLVVGNQATITSLVVVNNATVSGVISGITITGSNIQGTNVNGVNITAASITGSNINAVSGTFSTRLSGATITGNNISGTSGVFNSLSGTTITGGTVQGISGVFGTLSTPALVVSGNLTVESGLIVSGLAQFAGNVNNSGTFSGVTITGTTVKATSITGVSGVFTTQLSGATITGNVVAASQITGVSGTFTTSVSGATVTGNTGAFGNLNVISGVFTQVISGAVITGNAGQFANITGVSGVYTNLSGATITGNTVKVSTITGISGVFTNSVSGVNITGDAGRFATLTGVSGVFTTRLSGATVTGDTVLASTITGATGIFTTVVSGLTVTGDTGKFTNLTGIAAVFTTSVSGATVTGNTVNATTGNFVLLSGTTITGTAIFATTGTFGTIQATNLSFSGSNTISGDLTVVGSGFFGSGISVTGTISGQSGVLGLGLVTTPSFSFSGDSDTGIYSPAANNLSITTSGVERIRFADTGALGIGGANYGTSGQVFTSNGTSAAPSWESTNTTSISVGNTSATVTDTGSNGAFTVVTEGGTRLIIDSTGRTLIGTSTASGTNLLQVNSDALINGISVGRGAGAIATNVAIGTSALTSNTTGVDNIAIGPSTLTANTTGGTNIAIGKEALIYHNASDNTVIGQGACRGPSPGTYGSTANTAVGSICMRSLGGGNYNSALGFQALFNLITGSFNTSIGAYTGTQIQDGTRNTFIGYNSGSGMTFSDSSNTVIGNIAGTAGLSSTIIIGAGTTERLRIDSSGRTLIGTSTASGANLLQVNSDALINGINVGRGGGALVSNIAIGPNALGGSAGTGRNIAIGTDALRSNTGYQNYAIGYEALYSNTSGIRNYIIGEQALWSNTTGNSNIAIGFQSLNLSTGNSNTALGHNSLQNSTGAQNVAIGNQALYGVYLSTTGSSNIGIGYQAGQSLTSGSNNTVIGSIAGTAGLANTVIIAAGTTERLRIDSSGRLLVGTSTARSNFFGTTLSAVTQTEGTGGAAGRGSLSVINNDVSNNPPYVLLGRSGAATLGSNAAVVSGSRLGTLTFHGADGTNFIEAATVAGEVDGTPGTNDMPGRLVFSTTADGAASPTERLRIDSTGKVGINTSSPGYLLDVSGGDASIYGVRIGRGPGASAFNTVVGNGAFNANTTGDSNTAVGYQALLSNTTGSSNVGIGQQALRVNTTGSSNVAIGVSALSGFSGGSDNTACGTSALANTSGGTNTAVGSSAGNGVTSGTQNALLGYAAGSSLTTGSNNTVIGSIAGTAGLANTVIIAAGTTERARINNGGKLLFGTSTDIVTFRSPQFQIHSISDNYTGASFGCYQDSINSGSICFGKSRGTSVGSFTVVQSGDELGNIHFTGADGTQFIRGAMIQAAVDGTPGTNDMPGRLVFSTTADGAASPTERLRIDSNGFTTHIGAIGRGAPVTKTGNFTLAITENWIICNGTATITVTLPAASSWTGREVMLKTIAAFTVVSASSNVVPLVGGAASTAILAATAGKYATLVSDGTNWIIMQAN